MECYKILANWKEGVRTEEQYQKDIENTVMDTIEEGVEEMKENIPPSLENKKRKLNSEELE